MEKFNWKSKRVLVTGAGGFIGSHLAEYLVRLGAKVQAMVHYNSLGTWGWLDSSDVKNEINIFSGDITDRDTVRRAVKNCDMIFHLAALIGIPYSYEAVFSYVRTNILGTLNVIETARELGIGRIIHTSTSEVYGTALYVPIDENHPLQAQSPYSATKIGADKLVESFYRSFNLPVVIVRPFNVYGPRQSSRAIIPTIITQVLTGSKVCIGAIEPRRDFTFVKDTIAGFIAAAETNKKNVVGQVFNIATGREISIKDLIYLIIKLSGNKVRITISSERIRPKTSEVNRLLADLVKTETILNWRPKVSLEDGLARTIDWFKESKNVRLYKNNHYYI